MVTRSFYFAYNDIKRNRGPFTTAWISHVKWWCVTSASKPSMEMVGINWLSKPTYTHTHTMRYHLCCMCCYYNMQDIYDTSATLKYYRKIWKIADIWYQIRWPFHIFRCYFASIKKNSQQRTHSLFPFVCITCHIHNTMVPNRCNISFIKCSSMCSFYVRGKEKMNKRRTRVKVLVWHCHGLWWSSVELSEQKKGSEINNNNNSNKHSTSFFSHF